MTKILLGYQSYQGDSKAQVGQRLLNMYAEKNPDIASITASQHKGMQFMVGSKYPWTLIGTPGQKTWLDTGSGSAIQGMQVMGANLYVVTANQVYKVTSAAAKTLLTGGPLSGTQNIVDMANNGTQMGIIASDGTGWVAGSSSVAKITDANFPAGGASSIAYLDSYGIFGYANSIQFAVSNSYDFTTWPGQFASTIASPSNLVRVTSFNNNLWLFSQTSYEVWGVVTATAFPFQQTGTANTTRGLAAKFSVAQDYNTLLFLADDGIVYAINNATPTPVSTPAVASAIQTYKATSIISDAIGFFYSQKGHKFYVLTFPTAGATWVYDITQNLWHERQSFNSARWNPNSIVQFNGMILVGDYQNGKIYQLDPLTYKDDANPIVSLCEGAVLWEEGLRITHDRVRLDIDAGVGLQTGQGSNPMVMMQFSDDGGQTWSNERWIPFGAAGQYKKRAEWFRNGQSRERIYRFKITDPVPRRITGAYADVRVGRQ